MNNPTSSKQPALPHRLVLDERAHLEVSGVREIVRFDERAVVLRTVQGMLQVQGEDLKLKTLLPDGGRVTVDGTVSAVAYAPDRAGGFFRRLLG